jgi:hypothetical protein
MDSRAYFRPTPSVFTTAPESRMGCLNRIVGFILTVCFLGILWYIPQIMEDQTMPWEDRTLFVSLGLFTDLLLIAAAIFMRHYAAQQSRGAAQIHFRS